jgi:hypothetical protein
MTNSVLFQNNFFVFTGQIQPVRLLDLCYIFSKYIKFSVKLILNFLSFFYVAQALLVINFEFQVFFDLSNLEKCLSFYFAKITQHISD